MNIVVVGAGAWGTAFAGVLASRGHEVTLAGRDPEQARTIEENGHNPRHLPNADLSGVSATTIDQAPFEEADLVVRGGDRTGNAGALLGHRCGPPNHSLAGTIAGGAHTDLRLVGPTRIPLSFRAEGATTPFVFRR